MDIESALEQYGLTRREATTYISILKIGIAKASEIAQKAHQAREASYYTLKGLQEKGLVSEVIKSGVKHYSAIPPKRILAMIEEETREKTEIMASVIPELEALQKVALTRPAIEVYDGVEGFKTIVSKLVDKENQNISAYFPERPLHFLPAFHLQFRRRRREKNIHIRVITEKTRFMLNFQKNDVDELRHTRFNDDIIKRIRSAFFILHDAIIIINANDKEQLGVYIQEANTAQLHQRIFEKIWTESKP